MSILPHLDFKLNIEWASNHKFCITYLTVSARFMKIKSAILLIFTQHLG
jgi:hypothetical protein